VKDLTPLLGGIECQDISYTGDGRLSLNNVTNSHTITFEESYLTPEDLRREEAEVHC